MAKDLEPMLGKPRHRLAPRALMLGRLAAPRRHRRTMWPECHAHEDLGVCGVSPAVALRSSVEPEAGDD